MGLLGIEFFRHTNYVVMRIKSLEMFTLISLLAFTQVFSTEINFFIIDFKVVLVNSAKEMEWSPLVLILLLESFLLHWSVNEQTNKLKKQSNIYLFTCLCMHFSVIIIIIIIIYFVTIGK